MTEWYTGVPYYVYRSIWLFTPLGEALFYMGYVGILIIPFLYGLTTVYLERIYLQSSAYPPVAHLYIWSFLCMRLTFFNLFSAFGCPHFVVLLFIVVCLRCLSAENLQFALLTSLIDRIRCSMINPIELEQIIWVASRVPVPPFTGVILKPLTGISALAKKYSVQVVTFAHASEMERTASAFSAYWGSNPNVHLNLVAPGKKPSVAESLLLRRFQFGLELERSSIQPHWTN